MEKDKIASYLGFCIRSGNAVFGVDRIEGVKKGVYLLMVDKALGHSSFKTMVKLKEEYACPLLVAEEGLLGRLTCRPAVKAVAVKDKNLASAILSSVEECGQYQLYSGGII